MHRFAVIIIIALFPVLARADDEPAGNIQQIQSSPTLFARVRGLLDIDLPELDPPGTVKIIFRPHVSDFIRRDYLRTEAGFRWAVNDHFELSSELSTYVNHGLGSRNPGTGLGHHHFGAKYLLRNWFNSKWEASWSLNVDTPMGHPPIDMTDGLNHYSPGLAIQHHWLDHPRLTTFAGTSLDFVSDSSVPGTRQTNMPRDDSISFTLGGIYDLGQLKWTLAGTYTNTGLISGSDENFYYLRPSIQWFVPKKISFNSKTQWIVSFGTPMSWGPDGREFKVTTRLRAEITFRQVLNKMRDRVYRKE